ncbi:MAG: hypothetical protein FK730_02200 [Asgard group archaeon]|nr:hypothetical protein [Asgard group archaeon]
MIHFVWIIVKDTPIAGMRFVKMTDQEERERLEKFYGWLSGPISEFTDKIQDIILEGTKYYYHTNNDVLFIVGTDLDETSVRTIFVPELEAYFFNHFPLEIITQFDGHEITQFQSFNPILTELVQAFDKRKIDAQGQRKDLDAFEVLNLPNELQMVALILVKMQVVTPDMVSQVTGLSTTDVEKQLREIYQKGYLYITSISNKSYFSIKPFGSDEVPKIQIKPQKRPLAKEEIGIDKSKEKISATEQLSQIPSEASLPDSDTLQTTEKADDFKTTLMPQPDLASSDVVSDTTIKPKLEKAKEIPTRREAKEIKLKIDPIAQEIDKSYRMNIVIPKSGNIPQNSLRREKTFISSRIKLPNDRNKDPFLLNSLFRKDLENIFEALFMGDMIVVTSNQQTIFEDDLVDNLLEIMELLTPHRELKILKSNIFVHPKDADIVVIPKDLMKYYSWATIIDLDVSRIIGGSASEYTKNLTKKLRRISEPKELLREVTNAASVLLKIGRDINTLKIEGRSPDIYLNEVKKTFGVAALDAGLALSERLVRMHKDCAYIAGFYIRKGLDVAVRAILVGDPIVVIGDNPLDVYHIIEALSIFAPHKAINAQIWTSNLAEIKLDEFDIMGAQEGTDKLFKNAIKVNIRSMSAYGGSRSEFLHNFLRNMWRRRSKDRPKFIRDTVNDIMNSANKIIQKFQAFGNIEPTKQDIRDIFNEYDSNFGEFMVDLIRNVEYDIATKIKNSL